MYSKLAVAALILYDDGCLEADMKRFIEGDNRQQITLLPESLDEYIEAENPVRIIDVFVDQLDLGSLGFSVEPAATGQPSYHPSTLLKLYVYGYLNRIQSSRRLEREAQRNVELMWLLGRRSPNFKTIADFRRDNDEGIRNACRQFVVLCRQLNLFSQAVVAIDGSKFKAVNAHDRNFMRGKLEKRMQEIDRCIERYLTEMDTADHPPRCCRSENNPTQGEDGHPNSPHGAAEGNSISVGSVTHWANLAHRSGCPRHGNQHQSRVGIRSVR